MYTSMLDGTVYLKNKENGDYQKLFSGSILEEHIYTNTKEFYQRILNSIDWYKVDQKVLQEVFIVLKTKYDIGD